MKSAIRMAILRIGGPSEAAKKLGVSRSQVYRWVARGDMSVAEYRSVSLLAKLSGVEMEFLGEADAS